MRNLEIQTLIGESGTNVRNKTCLYTRNLFYIVLLFFFCSFNAAQADIYMVQNADGQMRFTNSFVDQGGYQIFTAEPKHAIPKSRPDLPPSLSEQRRRIAHLVQSAAQKYALDPALITAIIAVESGFNPTARSNKGAFGLMQLMPATARQYGVSNSASPAENISAGTRHFKSLVDRHNGNIALALAAYNAGDAPILKNAKRIPPYPETMLYVSKVLALYERYRTNTAD